MVPGGVRSYTIGEVGHLLEVKTHTIRYWEREIPFLSPQKNVYGRRRFSSKELGLLHRLRHLIFVNKYTLQGACERLWRELSDDEQDTRSHITIMRAELLEARSRLITRRRERANGHGQAAPVFDEHTLS